jgi:hypothetical protein
MPLGRCTAAVELASAIHNRHRIVAATADYLPDALPLNQMQSGGRATLTIKAASQSTREDGSLSEASLGSDETGD